MSRFWMVSGVVILAGVLSPIQLQAQPTAPAKLDVTKLGPQVGQQVPDFDLKDQFGATRNLSSIMGPRGAMLVFIRSADW